MEEGDKISLYRAAPRLKITDDEVQDRIQQIGYEIGLLTAPPHLVNRLIQERLELQNRLWVSRYLRTLQDRVKRGFAPINDKLNQPKGFEW